MHRSRCDASGNIANSEIKYFYACNGPRPATRIDNAGDIKQLVRKMRTGPDQQVGHASNDNAYLALEDLIIEYKAALVIIHGQVPKYPGTDRIITS